MTQDDQEFNEYDINTFKSSSNYKAFIKNALPEINRAIQEISMHKKIPVEVLTSENTGYDEDGTKLGTHITISNLNAYSIFKVEVVGKDYTYSPVIYKHIKSKKEIIIPNLIGTVNVYYYPIPRILTNSDMSTIEYGDTETIKITLNDFIRLIQSKSLTVGQMYQVIDLNSNQYKVALSSGTYRDATGEDGYIQEDDSLDLTEIGISDLMCYTVIPYLVKSQLWQEIEPEMAQVERNRGLQNLMLIADGAEDIEYQTEIAVTNTFDWR